MYKYRKIFSIVAAMLILFGALAMNGPKHIQAESPGVYVMPGNPNCVDLALGYEFKDKDGTTIIAPILESTAIFGFKLEGIPPLGKFTYPLTSAFGSLTGGAPQDPNNSVTVEGLSNYDFNWWSTLGIDAVIVKAANEADVYVYTPEAFEGGPLTSGTAAISHIEFCYDYELLATKTAEAKVYKTIDWSLTKDVTPASASRYIGEDAPFDYTVSVNKEVTFGPWVVEGTITVKNPTPWPVEFEVTDKVDGVPATVDCGGVTTLTANDGQAGGTDEVVCTYSISSATEIDDGSNVATLISKTSDVGGYVTKAVPFEFGDPILSADSEPEEITVDDTNGESWLTGISATWKYSETQTCSTNTALYGVYGFYSTDFNNTAEINETTGDSDSEKVTLTCYAPVVSKDADTEWKKKYDWTITKSVDPAKHVGFVGDEFTSEYDVVVDQTITDYGYKAFGKIYVKNPVGSPGSITVDVSDAVDGKVATVDCDGIGGTSLTVPTGETKSCEYTVDLADATQLINTATVKFNKVDFLAYADVIFGDPDIEGHPTINVTDSVQKDLGSASGDYTFEYTDKFTCSSNPADYKYGFDSDKYPNTATITETSQSDDAEVTVDCYAPVVTKDVTTKWDRFWDWKITKDHDASYDLFAGGSVMHGYKVTVTPISEDKWQVFGNIYVKNNHPTKDMTLTSVSDLAGGVNAPVTCPSLVVPAGGTLTCTYDTGELSTKPGDTNVATAVFAGANWTGQAAIEFSAAPVDHDKDITVDDDNLTGESWSASGVYAEWTYEKKFECSSDPGDYTNGSYSYDLTNTATITETKDYDTAHVDISCYAPVVTKTADASYKETWTWTLEKSVDETSNSGYPGDYLDWVWKVKVGETFEDSAFKVTGMIYIKNPAPMPMTVALSDKLDDGTVAKIKSCETQSKDEVFSETVTVDAMSTAVCYYTAEPFGKTALKNTATAVLNSIEFIGEAAVKFEKTVINGTATVTDTMIVLNESLVAGDSGKREWIATYDHTCSTERSAYDEVGYYGETISNTAYLKSDLQSLESKATTEYICKASFVDVLKTTNDVVDPTKDIRFKLYDGAGTYLNDEVSTSGDEDGQLQFQTALIPGNDYTICEAPVPAGYTFEITVDGGNVLTYAGPPGETNPTGEIQCFDFTAPAESTTVVFNINNRYPGGAPRTPGYWKNWSTCSGGNQQYTAAALGGVEAGVFLLDDLLPQTLGNFTIPESACTVGVRILSAQDVDTGKNMASDAAYTLARAMLAARLNQDAGACVPTADMMDDFGYTSLEEVLTAADQVLKTVNFDGSGSFLSNKTKDKTNYNLALKLSGIIDKYNNGFICTGEPSH